MFESSLYNIRVNALTPMIQSSFAYLLVFQILMVTGLTLTGIWLWIQRIKRTSILASKIVAGEVVMATEGSQSLEVVKEEIVTDFSMERGKLETKIQELESSNLDLKNGLQSSDSLREKVRFLESKLLEYEILQEEISTLRSLKQENEQLKAQISTHSRPVTPEPSVLPTSGATKELQDPGLEKLMTDIEALGREAKSK